MDIPRETIIALNEIGLSPDKFGAVVRIINDMLAAKHAYKGITLPEDWSPSERDIEYGMVECHLSKDQIYKVAENMRLWAGANMNRAIAKKAGLRGWGLALRRWFRDEEERCKPKQNGISRTSMIDLAIELGNRANEQRIVEPRARMDEPLLSGLDIGPGADDNARHR